MKSRREDNVVVVFEPASDVHWMKDVVQFPNALAQVLHNKNAILIARPNHKQEELAKHIKIVLFGNPIKENHTSFEVSNFSKIITDRRWYLRACINAASLGSTLILYPWFGNPFKGSFLFKLRRWAKFRKATVIVKTDGVLQAGSKQKASFKKRIKDKLYYFFIDKIIHENNQVDKDMRIYNPHFTSKLIYIPNCPIDIYHFQEKKAYNERSNTFLFVGRINDNEKGADILLNAWLEIANKLPDWRLQLAGSCSEEYRMEWQQKFNLVNLKDSVEWIGPAMPGELLLKYNAAKIVVCCSRKESGPIVLSEAILSGCAFIGTKVGEIPFVLEGLEGIIDKVENIGDVMIRFARNESISAGQAKKLFLRMKDRNWKKQVAKINFKTF